MWKDRYDELWKCVKKEIDKPRRIHTEGVAYTAAALAMAHGEDLDRAFLAGLLHDCGKGYPKGKRVEFCTEHGIPVTETERENPGLLHAKIGAYFAETRYGVEDREVLSAITYHTTGRPAMSLLEKIIYTADYIEPNREKQPGLPDLRALAFRDIDGCVFRIAEDTVNYLNASEKKAIDPMSEATYLYYRDLTERRNKRR